MVDCRVQVGWVTGPPRLIDAVGKAHQFLTFCLNGALQKAVAYGLDHQSSFFRHASVRTDELHLKTVQKAL